MFLDPADPCHTLYGMKMTMHIDEALLQRVVDAYGFASKTEAVSASLRDMDRRARFREVVRSGMGCSPEHLRTSVDPDYDPRTLRVAEGPRPYGKKP